MTASNCAIENETVAIVDDDEALSESLTLVLQSVGLQVSTYRSAIAFLQEIESTCHACLLLDIRMPGISGVELQRRLDDKTPCPPIIFMTGHADVDTAVEVMKRGAFDFLQKPFATQVMLDSVQGAIAKWRECRQKHDVLSERLALLAPLTLREREVFTMLGEGNAAKVAASNLGISLKTLEEHRSHIFDKLGIRSTAQLVALATEIRLIDR